MPRVVLIVALLAVYIYTVVDVALSDGRRVRALPKAAWLGIAILLPMLATILWFALGRPRQATGGQPRGPQRPRGPQPGPKGPDDDEEFLRNLETRRRNQAEAERLEKLRKDLENREKNIKDNGGTSEDNA